MGTGLQCQCEGHFPRHAGRDAAASGSGTGRVGHQHLVYRSVKTEAWTGLV